MMFQGLKRAISLGPGSGNARHRRSPSFEDNVRSASAPINNYEHDAGDDQEECDPLMYRLQHQLQFMKETQQWQESGGRSSGALRSLSDRSNERGRHGQRDPFDLRDSLTSKETSRRRKIEEGSSKETDDRNGDDHVDVVGWDSQRSRRRRSSGSSKWSSDENDASGLYVDFGGATPENVRRRRTEGTTGADELVETWPHSEEHGELCSKSEGRGVHPEHEGEPDTNHKDTRTRYLPRRLSTKMRKKSLSQSTMSSVTISSADLLQFDVDGCNGDILEDAFIPSHDDLATMLQSLERESSFLSFEAPPTSGTLPSGKSGVSTLSSPVEKCLPTQSPGENHQFPLPFMTSTGQASTQPQDSGFPTQQSRHPKEDCPRLAQLMQQTVSDLQSELSKMQFQSKSRLENSWAETEKMRVESSELDTHLERTRKELAIARAGLLTGGTTGERLRRLSLGGCSKDGCQFVLTKLGEPSRPPPNRNFRRRRTIDGSGGAFSDACSVGADIGTGSWMRSSFRRVDSAKSLVNLRSSNDHEFTPAQIDNPVATGKSFGDRRHSLSSVAASALSGSGFDFPPPSNNTDRSSDRSSGQKRRGSGLLAELRDSFLSTLKTSSGGSVASADFGVGLGIDDASSDGSSEGGKEFDDTVYNALLSPSSVPKAIERNPGYGDDNASAASSDVKSGVFYPSPSGNGLDDSSSDVVGGVFCPPPVNVDDEVKCIPRPPSMAGDSTAISCLSSDIMDDYDFDPLGENQSCGNSRKSASQKEKEHRGSFTRRPSFLGLFDAFDAKELDIDDDSQDEEEETVTSSAIASPRKKKKVKVSAINATILEKDSEIVQMKASIEQQEHEMQQCEVDIAHGNMIYDESDSRFKDDEHELAQDVRELQERDAEVELVLVHAEETEQRAKEREGVLEQELGNIEADTDEDTNDNLLEEGSDCSVDDLEERLSSCRQQYEASQENAIKSLSTLLDDLDAMNIPSLQGEREGNVSSHIVARFDQLTDKEEELVRILGDPGRLASRQASFEVIQMRIETSMHLLKTKLEALERELQSSLATINILAKREICEDDRTHTTESSTASERLASERAFVDATLSHLESMKQNEGRKLLDALTATVEILTQWDQLLLPEFDVSDSLPTFGSKSNLDYVAGTISEALASLAAVKSNILKEEAEFSSKMQTSGVLARPLPHEKSSSCTGSDAVDFADQGCIEDEKDPQHAVDSSEMEPSSQLSNRPSTVEKEDVSADACREVPEDLDRQIRRETKMNEYSSELASLHATADQEDSSPEELQ